MHTQSYFEPGGKKSLMIGTRRNWGNIKTDFLETDYLLITNNSASQTQFVSPHYACNCCNTYKIRYEGKEMRSFESAVEL